MYTLIDLSDNGRTLSTRREIYEIAAELVSAQATRAGHRLVVMASDSNGGLHNLTPVEGSFLLWTIHGMEGRQ